MEIDSMPTVTQTGVCLLRIRNGQASIAISFLSGKNREKEHLLTTTLIFPRTTYTSTNPCIYCHCICYKNGLNNAYKHTV